MNLKLIDEDHSILTEVVPEVQWPPRGIRYVPDPGWSYAGGVQMQHAQMLKGYAEKLLDFRFKAQRLGLAYNQVGLSIRMCVAGVGWPVTLINPTIIGSMGVRRKVESCLSFPGYRIAVNRPVRIIVESSAVFGERVTETYAGMMAGVISHTIDHLNGITILDEVHQRNDRSFVTEKLPTGP